MNEQWRSSATLNELNNNINTCQLCALGNTRTNFVFGSGNEHADIMFIGEAPGKDEDLQGRPFVGRAGKVLNVIIESLGIEREHVYIANILKCRPPGNRIPLPDEIKQCFPYLNKQIELVKPKVIIALGLTAANTLLKIKEKMSSLRNHWFEYENVPMLVTYHPAALLYDNSLSEKSYKDMEIVKNFLKENINEA